MPHKIQDLKPIVISSGSLNNTLPGILPISSIIRQLLSGLLRLLVRLWGITWGQRSIKSITVHISSKLLFQGTSWVEVFSHLASDEFGHPHFESLSRHLVLRNHRLWTTFKVFPSTHRLQYVLNWLSTMSQAKGKKHHKLSWYLFSLWAIIRLSTFYCPSGLLSACSYLSVNGVERKNWDMISWWVSPRVERWGWKCKLGISRCPGIVHSVNWWQLAVCLR